MQRHTISHLGGNSQGESTELSEQTHIFGGADLLLVFFSLKTVVQISFAMDDFLFVMSECPTLNYLAAIPQVEAMEKTGSHSSPKHFSGNDQESYRSGVLVFFTEQAFREGALRAFEGSVREAKAGSIMQPVQRLGLKWSSASYAMNTIVLRNE